MFPSWRSSEARVGPACLTRRPYSEVRRQSSAAPAARRISGGGYALHNAQSPSSFQWSESYCKLLPASTHYLLLSSASPGGLRPSDDDAVGVRRRPVAAEALHALVCPDPLVRSVVQPEGAEQLPHQTPQGGVCQITNCATHKAPNSPNGAKWRQIARGALKVQIANRDRISVESCERKKLLLLLKSESML